VKATYVGDSFPLVLFEDFFPADLLPRINHDVITSRAAYKEPSKSGSAVDAQGRPMKKNRALFLPHNGSSLTAGVHGRIWGKDNAECIEQLKDSPLWFQHVMFKQNHFNFMLSEYSHGDYYPAHFDRSNMTLLLWFYPEPKPFMGGDLIFPDFDVTVECKSNTGVLFFGPIRHEVTKVQGNGRYTLTGFTQNKDVENPRV
jgi:predicted 2-oxoglutarate/Fe(II)-dependent dioxygenase YbiX